MNKYIIFLVALSFAKDKVPFGLNLINEKESFLKNSILLNGVQIDVPGQIKNDSNRIKIDSTHLSSIIDSCFGKIKTKTICMVQRFQLPQIRSALMKSRH